ncbi:NAD-dependent protein deacylase, partial [candidate division WOR-3 bacterium]
GGLMRPDVVWFGEPVPEDVLREAFTFISGCDLLLVIGTSGVVQPAASIPIFGKNRNKTVAIINPEPTPLSVWADYEITGRAADVLPQIVKEVE